MKKNAEEISDRLKKKIISLSNDGLLQMVYVDYKKYHRAEIDYAKKELQKRKLGKITEEKYNELAKKSSIQKSRDTEVKLTKKRPGIITAVCIIGIIWLLGEWVGSMRSAEQLEMPALFLSISLLFLSVRLIGLILMLKMKKLGLILYTIFNIAEWILTAMMGFTPYTWVLPIILIGVGFSKYHLMKSLHDEKKS